MKIKYKHQRFQAEATRCVTDVFQGQPKRDGLSNFLIDQGKGHIGFKVEGFGNAPIVLDRESLCVSIRPRACFSPSYNKVKSQTCFVWLLTLL